MNETAVGRAPGKLYVAGEYAVVEPGHEAIVVAVNRFLEVRIRASQPREQHGSLKSTRLSHASVLWHRDHDTIVVDDADQSGWGFIISAIHVVEQFALECGRPLKYCDISVSSDLDDSSGKKYGLGSSAAVTVATVKALCEFYRLDIDAMQQYKLAFLAANEVQASGSGGDIAAGCFQGCIAYSSPDRAWVNAHGDKPDKTAHVGRLIDEDWPGLSIERLPIPASMGFLVGWTGAPASTPMLVADVQRSVHGKDTHESSVTSRVLEDAAGEHNESGATRADLADHHVSRYQDFVHRSDQCVQSMAEAFKIGSLDGIQTQIRQARCLLLSLTEISGTIVETPELHRLVSIAEAHGAAAKSSGAGGGDCGIAICGPQVDMKAIQHEWNVHGIEALNLHICAGDE